MAAVVREIRDAGATQPVLLGGLDYANDLSHWLDFAPDDDQLVASFHSYDFKDCADEKCWDAVLAPIADRVPVLTGELGAEDPLDGYVTRYLAWADRPRDRLALLGLGRPPVRPDGAGPRRDRRSHRVRRPGPSLPALGGRRILT